MPTTIRLAHSLLLLHNFLSTILFIVSANAASFNATDSDSQRRFPQAIIIGVKKAGTRALLEFLRLNPAIKAPGPEVHFFDRNFDKGFEWYRVCSSPSFFSRHLFTLD
ncbi:Heparan sulfate glucosamine 3-O-sulfotransferase 6 [Toxocara canis]|uniref:Heparan sulfate glucosamine 3-O-sulfotransferase 6 n=2 Tax=Toxocara canis TaxID=6265 RepID=A0A0B2V3F4_TOXCA|nr:Heparan sulfate glucosamine 3-O-sulfotransferase 6 [Toxocara canis]VDM39955.1 unnamed protein product [Toxocara canis]